jgi:hypothetical protein
MGDQPVTKPRYSHRTTQTQTSMLRVGFEPTVPVFERAKILKNFPLGGKIYLYFEI